MELGQEEETIMAPSLTKVNKTWIFITLQILTTQEGEASSKEAFKTIPIQQLFLVELAHHAPLGSPSPPPPFGMVTILPKDLGTI
jgi:hypothetical protein